MPFRAVPVLPYPKIEARSAEEDMFRLSVFPQHFERQIAHLFESDCLCLSVENLEAWMQRTGNPREVLI